jgi:hypothetical protein
MSKKMNLLLISGAILLELALLAGMVWVNTFIAKKNGGEKDFLVPWLAARTYLQYGDSPYSTAATQRAQIVYYGRLAGEGEDPLRLWLPFPIVVPYLPFALIPDYFLARGLWMTLLELALIGLAWTGLRLTAWKPSRGQLIFLTLFAPLWIFGQFALFTNSALAFCALSLGGALLALKAEKDELAGALLVLPLFQPGSALLVVVFLLVWMVRQRRWKVLAGLGMVLILLFGISLLFVSDWFLPFVAGAVLHGRFNPGITLVGLLGSLWPEAGPRMAWVLAGFLSILLLVEWVLARGKDAEHMVWTAGLTLAATPLIGFALHSTGDLFQILPLYVILGIVDSRWPRKNAWTWVDSVGLVYFAAVWLGMILFSGQQHAGILNGLILYLVPTINLVGLYWIRWWAIRPARTWWERMS